MCNDGLWVGAHSQSIGAGGGVGEDGSDGAGVSRDSEDCGCVEMVFSLRMRWLTLILLEV